MEHKNMSVKKLKMDAAQEFLLQVVSKHEAGLPGGGDSPDSPYSPVRAAYDGAVVLVTGGNGFLGKHLLEKLFRSCYIRKAYLLLRRKKGKSVGERINRLVEDEVFERVRKQRPDFADNMIPIEGDVVQLRAGIHDADWKTLTEEVEVIFHGAATINFEEHIKTATLTNVRGTREMIKLARECPKLRAFVHISTAYCHATRDRIDKEVKDDFYPAPVRPDLLIDMAETIDDQLLDNITPQFLQKWPNTYTFTKAVAEELVRDATDLPTSVVRPAIVICAYREPAPGWLDQSCAFGPSGLVFGGGLGLLHVLRASNTAFIDLVPVDYVNNTIIAAGWDAMRGGRGVYTVATARNPQSWGDNRRTLYKLVEPKYLSPKAVWYANIIDVENLFLFHLMFWFYHYIPAYVIDGIRRVLGKPPAFVKLYTKAEKLQKVLCYFTLNNWKFNDEGLVHLFGRMSEDDRKTFFCDIGDIDWRQLVVLWSIGVRKYLAKDGLEGSALACRRQVYFKWAHWILSICYFYILWKLTWFLISIPVLFVSYLFEFI